MTQEWYKNFYQRMSHSVSNSWRKHHQVAGKRQMLAGSIVTLIGVCLLIPGISQYVEVVYKDSAGGVGMALFLTGAALVLLLAGVLLSCIGYFRRRKDARKTLTYDEVD